MKKTSFFVKLLLLLLALELFSSCKTERINLRTLAPQNTLIYLETNDLGKTLSTLTNSESWKSLASEKPNFDAANGIQAAIAITGFETNSNDISLEIKPKFVVILDTNSYESTTISAVEQIVSKFFVDSKPNKSKIDGTNFLTWNSSEKRKISAAISGNIAFIGNDEATVKEFVAVKAGTSPNISSNETLNELSIQKPLAFGLVTKKGATEIGNFLSIRFAIEASENDIIRSMIAKIIPNLVEKSVNEITWVANSKSGKIEDVFRFKLNPEIAGNFEASFEKSQDRVSDTVQPLPANVVSATTYKFKSSEVAFQGFIRSIASQSNELDAGIINRFSKLLLESYGIRDDKAFFESIDGNIVTAQIGDDSDDTIVIASVRDEKKLRSALVLDDESLLKIVGNKAIFGEKDAVEKYLAIPQNEIVADSSASFSTIFDETSIDKQIVETFSKSSDSPVQNRKFSITNTNAKPFGIERIRVSEFGLFGEIATFIKSE